MPIVLEQLARENGVLLSDHSTPCETGLGVPPPASAVTARLQSRASSASNGGQCVIGFLGVEVNTASFAMYTFSFSVLVQALLLISISAAADHGRYRKTLLLGFAFTGAVSTMLFIAVTAKVFYLAALLAIIANTCIGSSFVLLNSFLPVLVRFHPDVKITSSVQHPSPDEEEDEAIRSSNLEYQQHSSPNADLSNASLLSGIERSSADANGLPSKDFDTSNPSLQLSTHLSSSAMAVGYSAAVLVQILSVFLVWASGGSTFSLRLVLFFIGLWWLTFTIPAASWLRPRPGPPLLLSSQRSSSYISTALTYLTHAWSSLLTTITHARRLKDILLFLAAWFLLSDAIATVSGTAILFAKTNLNMRPAALAMINVVVMLSGVFGALVWPRVARYYHWRPAQTILACLIVFEIIPLYALLGYVPAIKRLGQFGFQRPWETYPVGFIYGLVLGGLSSYSRALFGELVPPGMEAAFFALYAITDKGSSVFGPAIVGAITDRTGDIRPAFLFLAVLVAAPTIPLTWVDVLRGKAEGRKLVEELDERERGGYVAVEESQD